MKLFRLATFSLSSAIMISPLTISSLYPTSAFSQTLLTESNSPIVTIAQTPAPIKTGKFVTVEQNHPTIGQAKIITEKGKRYLELDSKFSTATGPAVEVLLHRNSQVNPQLAEKDYVSLAKLASFSGAQRYAIPDSINLDNFNSVVIWCRQFNVTFGFASLQ